MQETNQNPYGITDSEYQKAIFDALKAEPVEPRDTFMERFMTVFYYELLDLGMMDITKIHACMNDVYNQLHDQY